MAQLGAAAALSLCPCFSRCCGGAGSLKSSQRLLLIMVKDRLNRGAGRGAGTLLGFRRGKVDKKAPTAGGCAWNGESKSGVPIPSRVTGLLEAEALPSLLHSLLVLPSTAWLHSSGCAPEPMLKVFGV